MEKEKPAYNLIDTFIELIDFYSKCLIFANIVSFLLLFVVQGAKDTGVYSLLMNISIGLIGGVVGNCCIHIIIYHNLFKQTSRKKKKLNIKSIYAFFLTLLFFILVLVMEGQRDIFIYATLIRIGVSIVTGMIPAYIIIIICYHKLFN